MSGREQVLGRIRAALRDAPPPPEVPRDYARAGAAPPGSDAVIEQLVDRLVDYRAGVRVVDAAGLDAAVQAALGPADSVVVPDGLPADLAAAAQGRAGDPGGARSVVVDRPDLTAYDLDAVDAVLTCCRVAISATGTIILDGSADQGRRAISLVPDRHVVVVRAEQVVASVPEGLARVRPTAPLTLISGPSATSDIELSRVEGVHGPRTLEVVIVG